jgi:hypothetical protein
MDEKDLFIEKLTASRQNIIESTKQSGNWLRDKIQKLRNPLRVFNQVAKPTIGQMYMFSYDPKYKNILPYYDAYPLVFPIEFYSDGFLGVNLHYLSPPARANLLGALKKLATDNKYNDKTKLNISYEILRSYSRQFAGVENCIKRYLYSHVRSQFHQVSAEDWDKTIMLPLQKWVVNSDRKYAKSPPY